MRFRLLFWTHLLIILGVWTSPFWVSWKIIAVGIVLYYLQLFLIGNCILTNLQFESSEKDASFYAYCLERLGINTDRRKIKFVVDYIVPWIILGVSLFLQIGK